MKTLEELMARPLPTLPTIEDIHPKPWRLFRSVGGGVSVVDANCPDNKKSHECIVIGRLKFRTDFDKLLAKHIVEKLNAAV